MINIFFIFILIIGQLYVFKKFKISPIFFFILIVAYNAISFNIIELVKLDLDDYTRYSHNWKLHYSYLDEILFINFHSIILILLLIFFSSNHITKNKIDINFYKNFNLKISNSIFIIFLILSIIHINILEFKFLSEYNYYLEIRDPIFYAIDSQIEIFFLRSTRIFFFLSIGFFILNLLNKNKFLTFISLMIVMYYFIFEFLLLSRSILFLPVALIFYFQFYKNSKISSFLCILSTLLIFFFIIELRENQIFGLKNIMDNINLIGFKGSIFKFLLNTGSGYLNFAHYIFFENNYNNFNVTNYCKIISFSPLPSAIDNYSLLCLDNEIRINRFAPYNSFAMSLNYGIGYFIIFHIFMIFTLKNIQKTFVYAIDHKLTSKYLYTWIATFFLTYSLNMSFSYAIRNSFKFFIFVIALTMLVNFFSKKIRLNE